jgi:dihydroorotase
MRRTLLGFPLLVSTALFSQPYDLILKNGHVIDPKNNINEVMDVAIAAKKIAQVARNIPATSGKKVVDAKGLYVTPGLVDIHVHVYAGTGVAGSFAGDSSVYPDAHMLRSGVTTVVDAGSSGWRNFEDFKQRIIDRSQTRVLSMLNIVGNGMGGADIEQNTKDMDAQATAAMAKKYPQIIVGVKTAHYTAPDWIAVDRAVEAGKAANIPVMVDFGRFSPDRPYQDLVLKHLRPGDISTHMYMRAVPTFDDSGKLLPYLAEARKRGVIFDLGHGNASFSWKNAAGAVKQGWAPDSISTDAHIRSLQRSMKDMPTTMSKMLVLGIPLAQVIRMSTINAAMEVKRPEYGHLSVGAGADITVLRLAEGDFGLLDGAMNRYPTHQKLQAELTIRDGEIVWDANGLASEDWRKAYGIK